MRKRNNWVVPKGVEYTDKEKQNQDRLIAKKRPRNI